MCTRLQHVDNAIMSLETEMKAAGIWDDVLVVSASDFGRSWSRMEVELITLGVVTTLSQEDQSGVGKLSASILAVSMRPVRINIHNSGAGFIPTTSWEALWSPIAEWFGVETDEMNRVLPNKGNFPADHLFSKDDIFD